MSKARWRNKAKARLFILETEIKRNFGQPSTCDESGPRLYLWKHAGYGYDTYFQVYFLFAWITILNARKQLARFTIEIVSMLA